MTSNLTCDHFNKSKYSQNWHWNLMVFYSTWVDTLRPSDVMWLHKYLDQHCFKQWLCCLLDVNHKMCMQITCLRFINIFQRQKDVFLRKSVKGCCQSSLMVSLTVWYLTRHLIALPEGTINCTQRSSIERHAIKYTLVWKGPRCMDNARIIVWSQHIT